MAKGQEIVKYVTEKVVQYIDTPSDHRKQQRLQRKQSSEPWAVRWFGLIPLSISMMFGRRHDRTAKKSAPGRE